LGTATSLPDSGTCLAEVSQTGTAAVRWLFVRSAHSFQATETVLMSGFTCEFVATVSGTTITIRPDLARSQRSCGVHEVYCQPVDKRLRIELEVDRSAFSGEVRGNHMDLSGVSVWRAYDVATGKRLEDYQAPGTLSLDRQ